MKKRSEKPTSELPPDVKVGDLKMASWDSKDKIPWAELPALGLESESLTFYRTTGFGWVLTTLHISNPGSRSRAGAEPRTYGVTMDGKVVRVGLGPHVTAKVTVHLSRGNLERLRKYVDLRTKGMADAGSIRDRISSRRAQGQLHRQNGRTSWMW